MQAFYLLQYQDNSLHSGRSLPKFAEDVTLIPLPEFDAVVPSTSPIDPCK